MVELDRPNYIIDPHILQRFDQRNTVFGRVLHDERASFYGMSMYAKTKAIIAHGRENCTHIDFARTLASWTVHDHFHKAFSWEKLIEAHNVMEIPCLARIDINDPKILSTHVKETALMFGASAVGICELDRKWVYSYDIDGSEIMIPDEYTYAIVMTITMDSKMIATSPGYPASVETGMGYSRMAFCVACVAEFIRHLGYNAIPMGNDTALSIPLALDAGLGEIGRLGLLITPEHGPCIRLCKVFTDLPLVPDRPIAFGVGEFCRHCGKCIEACEADAIHPSVEPSYDVVCPSNNKGIQRWAVNHDRCYEFWIENGNDCSKCIAACPYTPIPVGNQPPKFL